MTQGNRNRNNLTLMLIVVVCVFILCHMPNMIWRIIRCIIIYVPSQPYMDVFSDYLNPIIQLLHVLNSSVNFLIYCFVGKKFRSLLKDWCCRSRR